ncbi:MAG: hypothetical protein J7M06_05200 [Proteobacteria bacterium]|nr:hypothetical protein [Pseudomonadota bacterium]
MSCQAMNLFERSLKRFLFINLGEVQDQRFERVGSFRVVFQIAWNEP